jgi:hypothetical protein
MYIVLCRYFKDMKIHWIERKLIITTAKIIRENDMYLDSLVNPNFITYPLVMQGFCDADKKIIQSNSGTTSPVATSRKIILVIS